MGWVVGRGVGGIEVCVYGYDDGEEKKKKKKRILVLVANGFHGCFFGFLI